MISPLSRLLFIFFALILIEPYVKAQTYCDFINKVQAYQDSVKLFERKNDRIKPVEVDSTSFDTNLYMKLFDKLSLPVGLECHLYSNYNTDLGSPTLYLRSKTFDEIEYINKKIVQYCQSIDSVISKKILEFKKDNLSEERVSRMMKYYEFQKICLNKDNALASFALDSMNRACDQLVPEDSMLGYLQYLFFHQFGEEFALYWHSNYRAKSILCSKKDVNSFLDYYRKADLFDYEKDKIAGLLYSDLTPVLDLSENECQISWFEIETHNGIFKRCYRIERHAPFRVRLVTEEKIANISARFFY
jgi:hypothetical protein